MPAANREAVTAQAKVCAIRHALVDIDLSGPATPPTRPVQQLRLEAALVRDLYHRCEYAGAARLLPTLLEDLHGAAAGPDREQLLRLLYDMATVASCLVRKLGHPADSWLAAERCRDIAKATEDPVLIGYAEFTRAIAAIACGSYKRGHGLAERAANDLQPHLGMRGGTEILGMLYLACAITSRGLKNSDVSEAWTAEATDLAQRTGETATFGLFFGPTNVNLWRLAMETDRGDSGRALEIVRNTNPAVINAAIRQVYFYTDAARAYARARGNDHEVIKYLLVAERLAPQHVHLSPVARETGRAMLERSRRLAGGPALRGLCERMGVAQ